MAGEDPEYSEWIRRQPCCAPGCSSPPPSEQHHKTGAGMGLRAHDWDSMPLCSGCHVPGLHALAGAFKGWTREQLAAWQADQADLHFTRYTVKNGMKDFDPDIEVDVF